MQAWASWNKVRFWVPKYLDLNMALDDFETLGLEREGLVDDGGTGGYVHQSCHDWSFLEEMFLEISWQLNTLSPDPSEVEPW